MKERMWKARSDADAFRTSCPSCGSTFIVDSERGERICRSCGYVASSAVDEGPEWKAIDLEEKAKRVRAGAPVTLTLHDLGLSTDIGEGGRDFHGKHLDPAMLATVQRMKKWQSRVRTADSRERALYVVLKRISELCGALSLPENVAETAAYTYRISAKMKVAKGKSIMGMTAATVYLACRKCGVNRTLKDIAAASGIRKGDLARYFRLVLRDVEKEYVPPPPVEKYISKIINLARLDTKIELLALQLCRQTNGVLSSGRTPAGLAAAYVYVSAIMLGDHIPVREIAEVADITGVTIRNRCRELLENFRIQQRLAWVE